MFQIILAILLLVIALGLFLWNRRASSTSNSLDREDPDVILGLTDRQQPQPAQPIAAPTPAIIRQILFLRAPADRPYGGYELLQSLLSVGLRFGENNIFHRYEQREENRVILFSVAAATQTGELNPAEMGSFGCPGLSLFVTLNQHIYPSVNFELMLDTVAQLAEDLGGAVLDETQALLTVEKIQQIRDKIKAFETSQQTMELFV